MIPKMPIANQTEHALANADTRSREERAGGRPLRTPSHVRSRVDEALRTGRAPAGTDTLLRGEGNSPGPGKD